MRIKLSIAAAIAVLLAIVGVTLASASADSDGDHGAQVIKLVTVTPQDGQQFIDLGKQGPSVGDQIVFTDNVVDESGTPTGEFDGGVCSIVRLEGTAATAQCAVTLSLADGQIAVQGLITFGVQDQTAPPFDLPITGGTDAFEGVGGDIHVVEVSATRTELTLHLIRPRGGDN
jgi:hypothetical protein